MFHRLIKNDLKSNKVSMLVISLFLLLTVTLTLSASRLTISLLASIDQLVQTAKSPHLLQMHSGSVNEDRLKAFVRAHPEIAAYQLADFVNVEGRDIHINDRDSLQHSSQDNGFSSQNQLFDFLLDQENHRIHPQPGQVYIPLYYYNSGQIKIGDRLQVGRLQLTVQSFVRDAQMNAGLVSSKRFLLSEQDLATLKQEQIARTETLIELRVHKLSQISALETAYKNAGLEAQGPPMITYPTIKMINGINDALMILVFSLLGLAVIGITLLCMRFALLTKMEEDLQQIAIMKVMGLPQSFIKKVYLAKYLVLTAAALVLGWCLSQLLTSPLLQQMDRSMGPSPRLAYSSLLELGISLTICLLVIWLTSRPLKRFKKMTPGQALKQASAGAMSQEKRRQGLGLPRIPLWDHLFFALKNVLSHKKLYLTMLAVLSLISLIILLPANLYKTVADKSFTQYLGVGTSHILVDISQTKQLDSQADQLLEALQADPDLELVNQTKIQNFSYQDRRGQTQNLRVSLGNHQIFPVRYSQGRAPKKDKEIALSKLNANELQLKLGDRLTLQADGQEYNLKLVGIYSDLTYGGKTAKASFSVNQPQTLTALTAIQVKKGVNKAQKIRELKTRFPQYKVTDVNDFFHQTFDQTLNTLKLIRTGVFWVGLAIALILMTLFVYMIVIKDRTELALCRMLGFSKKALASHYLTALSLISLTSLALAYLLLLTLGQEICSLLLSSFGISQLQLILDPAQSFLILPAAMLLTGLAASIMGLRTLYQLDIGRYLRGD